MAAFSKRHRRVLEEGSLSIRLNAMVRGRVHRLLARHLWEPDETDDFPLDDQPTFGQLESALLDLYGGAKLPGSRYSGDWDGFAAKGPSECLFDAAELLAGLLSENASFVRALNEVMVEQGVPWRMLDEKMVLLDSEFARDDLSERADGAIRAAGFEGANADLRRARDYLADGDGRGAVHRAGSAFEGVLMALLDRDHGKASKLLQDLNREGYFEGIPTRLRQPFIREVMEALPWMRNQLGGHGQGEDEVEVPRAYAELATDLAAAFSHFLVTLRVEREGGAVEQTAVQSGSRFVPQPDTSDFVPVAGASDDDIPF